MAQEPSRQNHFYGGQAVVEGVMMRGRDVWAVVVRKPDRSMHVESHVIESIARRHPVFTKPLLRGVIALGQALGIGFRALSISARESAPEEEQLSSRQMALSMTIAVVLFIGIFIVVPAAAFKWVGGHVDSSILVNAGEGVFRVLLLLGYLALIGRTKEIRRVFAYHGAEHKTINAYEAGAVLTPANVARFSTSHTRCGTSFLLSVMIIAIFVFAPFHFDNVLLRLLSRLVLIPVVAGIAYEFLRFTAGHVDQPLVRALIAPGLLLQRLTTREPDEAMLECAIAALRPVLAADGIEAPMMAVA